MRIQSLVLLRFLVTGTVLMLKIQRDEIVVNFGLNSGGLVLGLRSQGTENGLWLSAGLGRRERLGLDG